MSKPTKASINLGNETHARGFNDGLNGRPKTIKKSHAHAHRYHSGYVLGDAERCTAMRAALSTYDGELVTKHFEPHTVNPQQFDVEVQSSRPVSLWGRFMDWFRG